MIQDEKLKGVGNVISTVWKNQETLSKSAERLDEQFAVLARLSIRGMNDILIRMGADKEVITEVVIETAFKEWQVFRSRSDFRQFMLEWFLGKPLADLPPPPAKEEAPMTAAPGQEAEKPQAQEFGGDYGTQQKSDERNEAAPEV